MYQSLYRKYRPKKFCDLVGQEPIVKILQNSILKNKVSHAYLFSGPRGTGKTSTAKIFAKTVNCLHLVDGECCGKCKNCEEVISGSAVDIIEIDAASNNGVDEIRELRNNINLSCASLKYKVYIIDEVHMLSTGAFNALLKTLEEPPEHIIFILATTDPQKVPTTIVSRCQCYSFEKISVTDICSKLKSICKKEKISLSDEILEKISLYSLGGMRDALGLLEKIGLYGDNITLDDFNTICGYVGDQYLDEFVMAVIDGNSSSAAELVNSKYFSGVNLNVFFNQVIDKMKSLLLENLSDNIKTQKFVRLIECFNNISFNMKNSDNPCSVAIALLLDEMLSSDANTTSEVLNEENSNISANSCENNDVKDSVVENKIPKTDQVDNLDIIIDDKIIINNTFATATKEKLLNFKKEWKKLSEYILDRTYGSNVSFLLDVNICAVGDNNVILSFEYTSLVDRAKTMYEDLVETIENLLGLECYVAFVSSNDWEDIKKDYIKKKKDGYVYKIIDKNPIVYNNKTNKDSTERVEADIIFGNDIVEYE